MKITESDIFAIPKVFRLYDHHWEIKSYINEELPSGEFAEFGVGSGASINKFATLYPQKTIHGFDSFKGLSEAWRDLPAGAFAQEGLPPVNSNVKLWVGYFAETLPGFIQHLDNNNTKIKFLHVDCDLEYSTNEIFDSLNNYIAPGTFILFDEIYNGHDEEYNQELRAFNRWLENYNREVKLLFRSDWQQMFCEVTK
jgi:hypothetical protein